MIWQRAGLNDGIFINSPPLKDFNNLSNDVFSGAAANAEFAINKLIIIINIFSCYLLF